MTSGMHGPADFDRLGDLLGEACGAPGPAITAGRNAAAGSPGRDVSAGASRDPARLLATVWADVVGEDVAANAQPVQLRQGRLVVSVSSSAWAQTLHLMSEAIIARVNERLGAGAVERVVFRHAGWEENSPRRVAAGASGAKPGGRGAGAPRAGTAAIPEGAAAPLSAEQMDALSEVERLGLAPELQEKITGAMRAAFVRGEKDSVR
jgi:hypothetical protein